MELKDKITDAGVEDRIAIVQGDAFLLPFSHQSFDVLFLSQTLHHLVETDRDLRREPEESPLLREALELFRSFRDILAPDGSIVIRETTRYNLIRVLSRSGVARRPYRRVHFHLKQQPGGWSRLLELAGFTDIQTRLSLPFRLRSISRLPGHGIVNSLTSTSYVITASN